MAAGSDVGALGFAASSEITCSASWLVFGATPALEGVASITFSTFLFAADVPFADAGLPSPCECLAGESPVASEAAGVVSGVAPLSFGASVPGDSSAPACPLCSVSSAAVRSTDGPSGALPFSFACSPLAVSPASFFPFADVASQTTMAGSRVAAVLVSSPSASDKAQWLLALAAFDCTDSAMEPGISHSEGVHTAKTDATVPAMKRKYRM